MTRSRTGMLSRLGLALLLIVTAGWAMATPSLAINPANVTVRFIAGPPSAQVNSIISSVDYSENAGPVTVEVLNNGTAVNTASVAVCLTGESCPPASGSVLSETVQTAGSNGIYTFNDLKINRHGIYDLYAQATVNGTPVKSTDPPASQAAAHITIWDNVTGCRSNVKCSSPRVGDLSLLNWTVQETGTSSTDGS